MHFFIAARIRVNQNRQNYNKLQFCEICGYIKSYDSKFFFTTLFCCCFWIRDPGSGIRDPGSGMGKNQDPGSGIRDKHPGSATLPSSISYKRYTIKETKVKSSSFRSRGLFTCIMIPFITRTVKTLEIRCLVVIQYKY